MEDSSLRRYRAFFICNTTAFVASLFIILVLLDKKLSSKISARFLAVYGFIAVALLGLMGAYAAGSCRDAFTTIYSSVLVSSVFAYIIYVFVTYAFQWAFPKSTYAFRWAFPKSTEGKAPEKQDKDPDGHRREEEHNCTRS